MDATLQTEIVDERKSRLKSLEPTGVGSLGTLYLGAGLSTSSLPWDFRMPGNFSKVQSTFNYDEIIAREFPPVPASGDMRRPLIVTHPVAKTSQFRNRESEWRRTHAETLKSLENQWVVLEGDQVMAHGEDPLQVINEAKVKGVRTPYIFFVEQKTEDVVTIGL
ncbi:MAG TPA: DUF5678 domain-containing protein [Candidatus Binatia bacterium]|nr:DUF5678 domain-containing protein [Candidatus Binatia bacterium]